MVESYAKFIFLSSAENRGCECGVVNGNAIPCEPVGSGGELTVKRAPLLRSLTI
jgi:hypothetical protein